jgi:hypothetical protein
MPDLSALPLGLVGNIIAFLALGFKSVYDVYFNRKRFDSDIAEGLDSVEALRNRNKRGNTSTTVAFGITAISFALLIGADLMEKESSTEEKLGVMTASLESVNLALERSDKRIKKIEDTLWPPQGPGTYGNPNPPPYDPAGTQASLDDIKKSIAELKGKDAKLEKRLEEVIRAVNDLSRNVREHQKTMEQIKRMLPAPTAG